MAWDLPAPLKPVMTTKSSIPLPLPLSLDGMPCLCSSLGAVPVVPVCVVVSDDLDLVEEVVPIRGRDFVVARPRDANALLTEEAFDREEFMPYWAELWASGRALASVVYARSLRGASVLELGCGLALPSFAAAAAGGRVTASDWSPSALSLVLANADRNDVSVSVL